MMFDLTKFQMDMLFVISGCEKPKGLEIKEVFQRETGKEINHGRLYPNLDTLVERGLVNKGQLDKRTNMYSITQRGQREIAARTEWEDQYINVKIAE